MKKPSRKPRDERNLKDQARGTCEELRVQRHHPRICKSEDTSVVSKEERWFKKEAGKWVNGCSTRHLRNIRIYRGSWRSPTSTSPLRRDDKGISQPLDLHRISQSNKHTTYVLTKGIFDSPVRSFLRDSEGSKPPQRTGDRLQRRPQARWEVRPLICGGNCFTGDRIKVGTLSLFLFMKEISLVAHCPIPNRLFFQEIEGTKWLFEHLSENSTCNSLSIAYEYRS